ncbi:MAG: hypothetical protein U0176_06785 [Bacteroidia bacterium]
MKSHHPKIADVRKALPSNVIAPAQSSLLQGGGRPAFQFPRLPLPYIIDTDKPD